MLAPLPPREVHDAWNALRCRELRVAAVRRAGAGGQGAARRETRGDDVQGGAGARPGAAGLPARPGQRAGAARRCDAAARCRAAGAAIVQPAARQQLPRPDRACGRRRWRGPGGELGAAGRLRGQGRQLPQRCRAGCLAHAGAGQRRRVAGQAGRRRARPQTGRRPRRPASRRRRQAVRRLRRDQSAGVGRFGRRAAAAGRRAGPEPRRRRGRHADRADLRPRQRPTAAEPAAGGQVVRERRRGCLDQGRLPQPGQAAAVGLQPPGPLTRPAPGRGAGR